MRKLTGLPQIRIWGAFSQLFPISSSNFTLTIPISTTAVIIILDSVQYHFDFYYMKASKFLRILLIFSKNDCEHYHCCSFYIYLSASCSCFHRAAIPRVQVCNNFLLNRQKSITGEKKYSKFHILIRVKKLHIIYNGTTAKSKSKQHTCSFVPFLSYQNHAYSYSGWVSSRCLNP